MIDPFDRIGALRKKPVPRKCSTCADKRCAARWRAVDWRNCEKWTEENRNADRPER